MASSQRMSRVDTAWLRMDSDSNLMVIVGVWMLSPAVPIAKVRERVADRLLKFGRFKQKVVGDAVGAQWVDDKDFDINYHVCEESLTRSTKAELQKRVGTLSSKPLDPKKPLWRLHYIEDFGGRSVMIARIHHCIADGIALINVMLSITDGGRSPPKITKTHETEDDWWKSMLLDPITKSAIGALSLSGNAAAGGFKMVGDAVSMISQSPLEAVDAGLGMGAEPIRLVGQVFQDIAAIAAMPDDSATRLKGNAGGKKVVAWCDPMPLKEVKITGKALGCTINDVLLSCVSGAIGAYLREKGDPTAGKEIRAMVPVNLRPVEQAYKLGNRFGLAPLVLPVGLENPLQRVFEVHKRMDALKTSYQPHLSFSVLAVSGLLIKPAQDALLGMFSKKATAVMTNVPGPADKLKFCGSTLDETIFWVPQSGNIGMGVSILSYGGGVQFGLVTDKALCPDPQKIVAQFQPEFERLRAFVQHMPWVK